MDTLIRNSWLSLVVIISGAPCLAKEERVALGDVPRAVMMAVQKRFPQGQVTGAGKEDDQGQLVYEVQLTDKSGKTDVSLNPDGTIREIEQQIKREDLPKAVQRVLDEKYAKAKLQIAERVILVKNGKESLDCYEFKLAAGDQVTEVKISPDGKIKQEEVQTEKDEDS